MLPYQKVLFALGTSLASELAQEKWPVCLQVGLLKICSSFPAWREAQSRTRLCGACTEQENPWETSGEEQPGSVPSLRDPPCPSGRGCPGSGRRVLFPTVWCDQRSSGGGMMFRCSGTRVTSCTFPAKPSLSRSPKWSWYKITVLLSEAQKQRKSPGGTTGAVAFHFGPSQKLQDSAHTFQLILQTTTIKTAMNDANN